MNYKALAFIFTILFFGFIHLSGVFASWKSYALLTEDFGVLNEQDFILRDGETPPGPIVGDYSAFAVWQCFPTENADYKISCTYFNEPNLIVISSGQPNEFFYRRSFEDREDCVDVINQWKKLITSEDAFCVRSYFSGNEKIPTSNQKKILWEMDRIKSPNGCWTYFIGGCGEKDEDLEDNYIENPDQ